MKLPRKARRGTKGVLWEGESDFHFAWRGAARGPVVGELVPGHFLEDRGEDALCGERAGGEPAGFGDAFGGGFGGGTDFAAEVVAEEPEFAAAIFGAFEIFDEEKGGGADGDAGFFEGFAFGGGGEGFAVFDAASGGDEVAIGVADEEDLVVAEDDGAGGDAVGHAWGLV